MTTLSDLKEVKEALDAGLVSQAEYDDVKRNYLRAKLKAIELQTKELRAKEEALEARKEFQKKKADAELRGFALEAIVKHGSSLMSEEQRVDLVRDYVKMAGLDRGAKNVEPASKRQRIKAEPRDASPPQTEAPASTSAATNQAPLAPAPAPSTSTSGGCVLMNEQTLKILNMSGLDRGLKERDASVSQPSMQPAPAAVPSSADAPTAADEDEYSNCSADDGEDDADCDEPRTGKRCKLWTEDDDAALVAALRAGQKAYSINIAGRSGSAAYHRLLSAIARGYGSPALRKYLEETCPDYVYKGPSERLTIHPWSETEELMFIKAHKEGKTFKEIAAMLPGRTERAVRGRLTNARHQGHGSAALKEYAAECTPSEKLSFWSAEEDQTIIQAHKEGKTFKEIASMLPGRTEGAVGARWSLAKSGRYGSAALRAYAAENN